MSEQLKTPNMQEMLRPTVTPEMGFQSYEMLEGDAVYRASQGDAFMKGEIRNPTFDYPHIDEQKLRSGIDRLNRILSVSRSMDDKIAADAVWDTASYHMAEMYWLMETKRLNTLAGTDVSSDEFLQSAQRYQELNEQLYGVPSDELIANVYGEILAQAKSKKLSLDGKILLSELSFGTKTNIAGQDVKIPGILGEERARLPENVQEKLKVLSEVLREEFADVYSLVESYWDNTVEPRATNSPDEDQGFNIHDMESLFNAIHTLRDPENVSGISIVIDPNATALSWDTPSMSIKIGASRKPITSKSDMVAKIVHEYGVHGLRTVNGLKTDFPVLGTGIYSEADDGEKADYLTFEEGFASLCEIAIDDSFSEWKAMHTSRYLAVAAAYKGADFRQAFEMNWRARVLMTVKDGQEITEQLIEKEQKQAYVAVRRVYRGTPVQLAERPVLTFNKDLAYLEGKIDGLKYLEAIGDDKEAIRRLFAGRFDPLNHRQNSLAEKYIDNSAKQR